MNVRMDSPSESVCSLSRVQGPGADGAGRGGLSAPVLASVLGAATRLSTRGGAGCSPGRAVMLGAVSRDTSKVT